MLRPQEKKKEKGSQEGKKTASDVCKLYNLKVCKSQADKECKTSGVEPSSTAATNTLQEVKFA